VRGSQHYFLLDFDRSGLCAGLLEPLHASQCGRAAAQRGDFGNVAASAGCRCNRVGYHRENHRGRGAYPFTNNSNTVKTAYKIEIPYEIQTPKELTEEPITLGDHLRRRRLELGLYQKDVASQIGVTTSTIWNWENGWLSITLSCMPKVIKFLGYNPIPCPEELMERLSWYKLVNGLPLEELGAMMGRDPEQLSDWLSGRHNPCQRNSEKIESFLNDRVQKLISTDRPK
jgi:transcriptional regulator with XRE-family HTH domain